MDSHQFQVTVHNKKVIVARVGAIMVSGTKSHVPVLVFHLPPLSLVGIPYPGGGPANK